MFTDFEMRNFDECILILYFRFQNVQLRQILHLLNTFKGLDLGRSDCQFIEVSQYIEAFQIVNFGRKENERCDECIIFWLDSEFAEVEGHDLSLVAVWFGVVVVRRRLKRRRK